jgi:hypothetical protein
MHHYGRRRGRLFPPILRFHLDFFSDPQQSLIPVMVHNICLDGTLRTSELVEVCEPVIICKVICYGFILNSQFYWVFYIWLYSVRTLRASLSQWCWIIQAHLKIGHFLNFEFLLEHLKVPVSVMLRAKLVVLVTVDFLADLSAKKWILLGDEEFIILQIALRLKFLIVVIIEQCLLGSFKKERIRCIWGRCCKLQRLQ